MAYVQLMYGPYMASVCLYMVYIDVFLYMPSLVYLLVRKFLSMLIDFSNLIITFDHDLQMTRKWYHSKALVEARGFRKITFFDRSGQIDPPPPCHLGPCVETGFPWVEGVKSEAGESRRGPRRAK